MEIPKLPLLHIKGQQHPRWYTRKQLWLLGEYHFYHVESATMGLTKEDLLAHSRYIRDTLVPKIAKDETIGSKRYAFDLTHLRSALEELHNSPMTIEILSFSRIEKALQKIAESHGRGWPPDIVIKAKGLIAQWEGSLGPLRQVRTDPWGIGGRLEGLARPEGQLVPDDADQKTPWTLGCSVERTCNLGRAHEYGHSGFKIGDWWLNVAAACREGVVDNPQDRVTADDDIAYAIIMAQHTESNISKDESCSYTPDPEDPGVFKLMATINGEQRNPVRVIRSWRLDSPLAPTAGIRYDGLYRVTGYNVKLSHNLERDRWCYTFHLKREPGQEGMEKALTFPNSEQLDDWDDYTAGMTHVPEDEVLKETYEGVLGGDQWGAERLGSIDSGYFSPHPTALKGEVSSP